MTSCLDAALQYAASGYPVFPVRRDKSPHTPHGFKDASRDPDVIRKWWETWPDAGVGIPTGATSGLVALDEDPRNGGDSSLKSLLEQYGPLPTGPVSKTGGGGHHFILKHPGGSVPKSTGFRPGLDLQADNAYIIAPPSPHPSGNSYAWERPFNGDQPPMVPAWLLKVAYERQDRSDRKSPADPMDTAPIPEGQRHATLVSIVGRWRNAGVTPDAILMGLREVNAARCRPMVNDYEIRSIAQSAGKWPEGMLPPPVTPPAQPVAPLPPHDPHKNLAPPPPPVDHTFTELGLRDRFVTRYGEEVHYDLAAGRWLVWNGEIWTDELQDRLRVYLEGVVDSVSDPSLGVPVPEGTDAVKWLKALEAWRKASSTDRTFNAVLRHLQASPGIGVQPRDMDSEPWFLPVREGLVDLKTGELVEARKKPVFTHGSPFRPIPGALCPKWEKFLTQFAGNDLEVMAFLQRFAYWCMTGDTSEQVVFDFWGQGGNGKTTFLETIAGLAPGYTVRADPRTFSAAPSERVPNDLARMRGARLILVSEPSRKDSLNEDLIHRFTGGDQITARFLHKEYFDYRPTGKLVFYGSDKIRVDGQSKATWRRMIFIKISYEVVVTERIKDFHKILLAEEGDGILHWALQGRTEFLAHGLAPPAAITQATEEFKIESDWLAEFLNECVTKNAGPVSVSATDLITALKGWAKENGEDSLAKLSAKRLNGELRERGFTPKRESRGVYWQGVDLTQRGRNLSGQKALREESFGKEYEGR